MPPDEGPAGQTTETGAGGQNQDDGATWREENTKLRQQLAEQKALNSKAIPWVNVALELQKQQPEIFQKLVEGKPLTKSEQQTVGRAQDKQTDDDDDRPPTRAEFKAMMQENLGQMIQQMNANNQAAKAMDELDDWATKEMPGYANVKGTRTWGGFLGAVLESIRNGTMEVPQDVKDPYKFAFESAYALMKLQHPELLKGERRGKGEDDRAAEILLGGRKASSSKGQDQEEDYPEEIKKELDFIRSIGQGGGKKFSP